MQRVRDNENAGNNRRLLTKTEDFCSEMQFRVLPFLHAGFRVFAQFGPGLRILVPQTSGVTEQLGAVSNFALKGLPEYSNGLKNYLAYSYENIKKHLFRERGAYFMFKITFKQIS